MACIIFISKHIHFSVKKITTTSLCIIILLLFVSNVCDVHDKEFLCFVDVILF